jgi:hypothetical protein
MQYMIVGNPKRKRRSSRRRRRARALRVVHKRSRRRRRHNPAAAFGRKFGGVDVMGMALGAAGAIAFGMAGSAIADKLNISVVNAKTEPETLAAKLGRLGVRAGLVVGAPLVAGAVFKPARRLLTSAAFGAGVVLLVDAVRAFAPTLAIGDDEMAVMPGDFSGYVPDPRLRSALSGYVPDPRIASPLAGAEMLEPLY